MKKKGKIQPRPASTDPASDIFYGHCIHCQGVPYKGFDFEMHAKKREGRVVCRSCGRTIIAFGLPDSVQMKCDLCESGDKNHAH